MFSNQVAKLLGLGLISLLTLAGCVQTFSAGSQTSPAGPEPAEAEDVTESEAESTASTDRSTAETENEVAQSRQSTAASSAAADESSSTVVLLGGTNIAQHSVPLEEIYFDTFNGRYVRLSDATESDILRLRDAIPPIENPKYTDVAAADQWLTDNDIVIGYVAGDEALAYPARILNYHEIVNETVNGVPVLISYCPLCNSGIVYDRRLNGEVLEFGNTSALYNSDMVMYDKQTNSYWFQVEGKAIVGDLTGQRMEVLPTMFMRWPEWRDTYPDSRVLSLDTGFSRPYERDPFTRLADSLNGGRFPFPVNKAARDPALPAGEQVISLVIDDEARAYPTDRLAGEVINDEVGGIPVAVIVNEAGTATVLNRQSGEQTLTLSWDGDSLIDQETGSSWTVTGLATAGPLEGSQLEQLPARFSFWFAFIAALPEGTAYQP